MVTDSTRLADNIDKNCRLLMKRYEVDYQKAEEAVHRGYANALEKQEDVDNFQGYWYVASKNELLNMFDEERRMVFHEDPEQISIDSFSIDEDSPGKELDKIRQKLPEVWHEVFDMTREGVHGEDIANKINKSYGAVRVMKTRMIKYIQAVILTLMLLIPVLGQAQVNIISTGGSYFYVVDSVTGDTLDRHSDKHKAIQTMLNSGNPNAEIIQDLNIRYDGTIYPDTVFTTQYDTLYEDTLYVEKFMYSDPIELRNVRHMYVEDSTKGFQLEIKGSSPAQRIHYASKCIGYDSTMTAIDDRVSFSMYPDSLDNFYGITRKYDCYYKDEGMNAMMTYWLTAYTNDTTYTVIRTLDVAHELNIGN